MAIVITLDQLRLGGVRLVRNDETGNVEMFAEYKISSDATMNFSIDRGARRIPLNATRQAQVNTVYGEIENFLRNQEGI